MRQDPERHLAAQRQKLGGGRVGGSVIDKNGLVALAGQRACDFARQRSDIAGLIFHRHDDGKLNGVGQ